MLFQKDFKFFDGLFFGTERLECWPNGFSGREDWVIRDEAHFNAICGAALALVAVYLISVLLHRN